MDNTSSEPRDPVEYHFDDEVNAGEWISYVLVKHGSALTLLHEGKPISDVLSSLHAQHPEYFHQSVLKLLEYLLSHPKQALPRDDLSWQVFQKVKGGNNLSTALYRLRRLLGDSGPSYRMIKDITGRQLWFELKRKPSAPNIVLPEDEAEVSRLDQLGILWSLVRLGMKCTDFPTRPDMPTSPLIQLMTVADPDNFIEVAHAFVTAIPGAEFQFRCSVFFEAFLHKHTDAVKELKRAAEYLRQEDDYQRDPHRLEALPAAAAAHLLGATAEFEVDQREHLNTVLIDGIRSAHPQVVEITLQNLMGAVATNPDVERYFRPSEDLLTAIDVLVQERLSPEYLGGLCSAVQFLLNCCLLYKKCNIDTSTLDAIIGRVPSDDGSWAWYVARFIKLHRLAFTSAKRMPSFISEYILIPPSDLSPAERDYQEHVTVIYSKLFYAAYRQAHASADGYYGNSEAARRSYGKAGAHINKSPVRDYLFSPHARIESLGIPDPDLVAFILGEFQHILSHDKYVKEAEPKPSQIYLATKVPFLRFKDKQLAMRAEREKNLPIIKGNLMEMDAPRGRREQALVQLWFEMAKLDPSRFRGAPPKEFTVDEVRMAVRWAEQNLAEALEDEERRLGTLRPISRSG